MPVRELPPQAQAIIAECLRFILATRELDSEFETRMGVTKAGVTAVLEAWPDVDDAADDSCAVLAINNALNEICHGIPMPADWTEWFSVPLETVRETYRSWARTRAWTHTGLR